MNEALILIDIQNDYFIGGKNVLFQAEQAAFRAKLVLDYWRQCAYPVYHVKHINPEKERGFFIENTIGAEINDAVKPLEREKIIVKHAPNSFYKTSLMDELKEKQIVRLTVCGMMSHMCIDTTVRAARDLGFETTLIQDACATKDLIWHKTMIPASTVHYTFMAALQGGFAKVVSAEECLKTQKNRSKCRY